MGTLNVSPQLEEILGVQGPVKSAHDHAPDLHPNPRAPFRVSGLGFRV